MQTAWRRSTTAGPVWGAGHSERFVPAMPSAAYFVDRTVSPNRLAEALSKYSVMLACVRRMEAGNCGGIGPSRQAWAACALRASGTTAIISLDLSICRTDMEMACRG